MDWGESHYPQELVRSVSHTTRLARKGEVDGKDYHFVDREEFGALDRVDGFLETAEIYGHRYGTAKGFVMEHLAKRQHVLLEIDWQGAMQVRERWALRSMSVFILPPDLETLRQRIRSRAKDAAVDVEKRMRSVEKELAESALFDHRIVNDDLDTAFSELTQWMAGILAGGTQVQQPRQGPKK